MKVVSCTIRCEMCGEIVRVVVDEDQRPLPSPAYSMVPMRDQRGGVYYGLLCPSCRPEGMELRLR